MSARHRRRVSGAAWILVALALPSAVGVSFAAEAQPPIPTDLVEHAGVALLLLDVEAVDRKGRPMRGLTKDDFQVRLDFRQWPVYSVDDFCGCGEPEPGSPGAATSVAGRKSQPAEPRRFVLYFEFSQMQQDGRVVATREAKRWVTETMEAGDEVMLVASSSARGTRRLTPFTTDRRALLTAIDEAFSDSGWMDTFAMEFDSRIEECENFLTHCYGLAMQESFHGRSAMKALETFMASLERTPGRKNLILFSQNGVMFPGVLYGIGGVPDHFYEAQELAAAATGSETVLYATNVEPNMDSPIPPEALVLDDNLADFTGGGYNRGAPDLAKLTAAAGRGCRCIYRIGLVPPKSPTREVKMAKVIARGVVLDYRYRVRFFSEREKWLREAQAVLADPASARDLKVSAAIVPESAGPKSWDASIQVAFDTRSLALLPSAGGPAGEYEIGALLHSPNGSKPIEMLETVGVRAHSGTAPGGPIVHALRINGLEPGDYRLAAFVRDRSLNVFGGAEALLTLPSPRKGGAAGPVLLLGPQARSVLPLRRMKRDEAESASPEPKTDVGVVPMGPGDLRAGASLSGLSWICPGRKKPEPASVLRFLAQEGMPLFRFEPSPPARVGECLRYGDVLDTADVKADAYAYHVLWLPQGEHQPRDAEAVFEIVPAPE